MYFPVANIDVNPMLPFAVAFGVSFFTSMGGVSGAFLLLPFQMTVLGYTTPSVSATNQLFNIVAIPSGVLRFLKEGRMVWPLALVVVVGTLPGVLAGAIIRVRWLPDPAAFKLFAAGVLLWIGYRLAKNLLEERGKRTAGDRLRTSAAKRGAGPETPSVRLITFSLARIRYEFGGEIHDCPVPGLFALALVVGVVGGIYGIGGGSIIAPFFVAVFGLPVHTVAGAALMGTFVTSVAGVAFYQAIAPYYPNMSVGPDWKLGVLLGLGGMVGMYLGARCQKHFPARYIKWMLAAIILFTAGKYVTEFLMK